MPPTTAAALAAWQAAIAAFEGLSDGVVCTYDGVVPMLEVSSTAFDSTQAAIRGVRALPKLALKTWRTLIDAKVGRSQSCLRRKACPC